MTGVARNLVERINKVNKEDGTGGGGVMREVAIDERLCGVDDKVRATRHSNANLTIWLWNIFMIRDPARRRGAVPIPRGRVRVRSVGSL